MMMRMNSRNTRAQQMNISQGSIELTRVPFLVDALLFKAPALGSDECCYKSLAQIMRLVWGEDGHFAAESKKRIQASASFESVGCSSKLQAISDWQSLMCGQKT